MTAQILDRVLTAYRIGDPAGEYPIFSAEGARAYPGRWNTEACAFIYASEHYSTAMLEKLVHGSGALPAGQHYIQITIPSGVTYQVVTPAMLPGWDAMSCAPSKAFGDTWCRDCQSLLLLVPSLPARIERNILINPAHPQFARVTHSLHEPVWWDRRLFAAAALAGDAT